MNSSTPHPQAAGNDEHSDSGRLASRIDEFEESVDNRVRQIELDVATRRNYEKVVIVLGYGAIALIAVLGFIGFSNVSDIDKKVSDRIDFLVSQTENKRGATLDTFDSYSKRMHKLFSELEGAEIAWSTKIEPKIRGLEGYDPDADLHGRYVDVMSDAEDPSRNEEEWRQNATALVVHAIEHVKKSNQDADFVSQFSPDQIFNLAQISRRLGRNDLEYSLTRSAHEAKKSSAAARALFLQSEARRQDVQVAENSAFNDLLDLVRNLTLDSPHIVIAEAWNAAEDLRQYASLIGAIDDLIERQAHDEDAFLPSYALVIKGQAHQRRGLVGDLSTAVAAYSDGVERLAVEGVRSQWGEATMKDVLENAESLFVSNVDTTALDNAIDSSGIGPLQFGYEKLRQIGISGGIEGLLEQLEKLQRTEQNM